MSATLHQKPEHRSKVTSWGGSLGAFKFIWRLKALFRSKKSEEAKNASSQIDSSGSDSDRDGEKVVHCTNCEFVQKQQSPVHIPVHRTNHRLGNDGSPRRSINQATQSNVSLTHQSNDPYPPLMNEAIRSNTSLDQRRNNVKSNARSDYEELLNYGNGEYRTTGHRQTTAQANNRQQSQSGRESTNERESSNGDVNTEVNSSRSITDCDLDRNSSTSTRVSRREFCNCEKSSISSFADRRNNTGIEDIEHQRGPGCHGDYSSDSPTQRNSFDTFSNRELDDDAQSYSGQSRITQNYPTASVQDHELQKRLRVEAMKEHAARFNRNQPIGKTDDRPKHQTISDVPEQPVPLNQQVNGSFMDLNNKTRTLTSSLRNNTDKHQSSLELDRSRPTFTVKAELKISVINDDISQSSFNKSAETVVNNWMLATIDSRIEKLEERMARLEHERQEQEIFEKSMADARNALYHWQRSVSDNKIKTAASVEKCCRKWKKTTDKNKTAREIEELDLQKESAKQRRKIVFASKFANIWIEKTPAIKKRNQWRVQEKERRVLVEQSFADKQSNQKSLSDLRDQEMKRTLLEKSQYHQSTNPKELHHGYEPNCGELITPEEALISCGCLTVNQIMSKLNQKLGTGYDANVSPEIEEALQFCISKDYDFGLTYALLRHCLTSHVDTKQANIRRLKDALDVSTIERRRREQDVDLLNPHDNGYLTIATPYEVKPRRVWDLISHRIIPWECANLSGTNLWAISHSWLDPSARKDIKTAVNGYEWPVPVPMGVTLETVRNELLSYGAEYCWLDILCLRQHSSSDCNIPEEKIRALEWQIDVPTIGNVYFGKKTKVLRYYNGLGKQFEPRGWNSLFHWTRRAWTLQECKSGSITGGVYDGDFTRISKMVIQDGCYQGYTMQDFENSKEYAGISDLLDIRASSDSPPNGKPTCSPKKIPCGLFGVLSEMRRRHAKTDADKVAGIGFLMSDRLFVGFRKTVELPVFSENMDAEEAWMRCVRHMPSSMRDELLFRFPMAGSRESGHSWFPSWSQISDINTQLPKDPEGLFLYDDEEGHGKWKNNECSYNGYFVEEGKLMWGEMGNNERRGKLLVNGHFFNVLASHQHPIPEGAYSLFGRSNCQDFVICSPVAADVVKYFTKVQKISVIQLPGCHKQLLGNAGVTMRFCTFL